MKYLIFLPLEKGEREGFFVIRASSKNLPYPLFAKEGNSSLCKGRAGGICFLGPHYYGPPNMSDKAWTPASAGVTKRWMHNINSNHPLRISFLGALKPFIIFLMFFFEYCKVFNTGSCEATVIDNPLAQ